MINCINKVLTSNNSELANETWIDQLPTAIEALSKAKEVQEQVNTARAGNKVKQLLDVTVDSNNIEANDMADVLRQLGERVKDTALSYSEFDLDVVTELVSGLDATVNKVVSHIPIKDNAVVKHTEALMAKLINSPSVKAAIAISTEQYVAENLAELATPVVVDEFIEELGIEDELDALEDNYKEESLDYLENAAAKGGKSAAIVANDLGLKILANLGVVSTKDLPEDTYKEIVTRLGAVAIDVMVKKGLVYNPVTRNGVRDATDLEQGYLATPWYKAGNDAFRNAGYPWVRVTNEARENKVNLSKAASEIVDQVEEVLGIEADRREPSFKPIKGTKAEVRRQPLAKPKEHLRQAQEQFQEVQWGINKEAVDVLREVFPTDEELLVAMGMPEVVVTSKDKADSIEAQRRAMKDTVMYFNDFLIKAGDTPFYFKWFIARNERLMIDSNTVNPQSDKNLARWLMQPSDYAYEVNGNKLQELLNGKDVDNTSGGYDAEYTYLYGIVQAFDGLTVNENTIKSVDNRKEVDVIADAKVLLGATREQLVAAMKAGNGYHVGHAALALVEIGKYNNSEVFSSNMTLETDGLTNGMAFKMLQFPLDTGNVDASFEQMMQKTGVGSFGESMAEWKGEGKELDIYQTLGKALKEAQLDILNHRKKVEVLEDYIAAERLGLMVNQSDLQEIGIGSALRKMAKAPTMVFGYGASVPTIVRNYIESKQKELADKIAEGKLKNEYENWRNAHGYVQGDGTKVLPTYKELQEALQKNSLKSNHPAIVSFKKHLNILINHTQGVPGKSGKYTLTLETALKRVLGAWQDQNDVFNAMFDVAFKVFEQYFEKKVQEMKASGVKVTEEDKLQLVRDVIDKVPALFGYNGDKESMIVLIKDKAFGEGSEVKAPTSSNRNLMLRTLLRSFTKPGAAAGPVGTHSMDSAVMTRALAIVKEKHGVTLLNIFDASVGNKYIGEFTRAYNQAFIEINKEYSLMKDAHNMLKGAIKLANDNGIELDSIKADKLKTFDDEIKSVVPATFYDVVGRAEIYANTVAANRKQLFDNQLTVGQMVGFKGTTYEYNKQSDAEMSLPLGKVEVTVVEDTTEVATKGKIVGENITSSGSDLGRKLTNVGNSYGFTFGKHTFVNSEHGYQTWKTGKFNPVGYRAEGKKVKVSQDSLGNSYKVMVAVIDAKLRAHPELVEEITAKGGVEFLQKSTHVVNGDNYWESGEGKENKFIEALTEAYERVVKKEQALTPENMLKLSTKEKELVTTTVICQG